MPKLLHTGRLVLTPTDPYFAPDDQTAITTRLQQIGLIGAALNDSVERFLLGERFMQLVTFMGCSPYIQLEPGRSGEAFCHLVIDGPSPYPRLLRGKNTTPPRCAACRKRIDNWRDSVEHWLTAAPGWWATCPHCGHAQDPATYDFRQTAGCGRLFLFIENIFPQEAVPSPTLLDNLSAVSEATPWHYFYQQE
ncbi:MAG: hypothetical protein P8098_15390 [Candidatus Thiodiazotropha sp.]